MIIRAATHNDITELSRLAQRTYAETFGDWVSHTEMAGELQSKRSEEAFTAYLALGDDILVGVEVGVMIGYVQFGNVKIPELTDEVRAQELHRLYLDAHYHGRGYGAQLLNAALTSPRMQVAASIYLDVWDKNYKALSLYHKAGFVGSGRTDVRVGDTVIDTDLVMKFSRAGE